MKKISLLAIVCLSFTATFSQSFMHGAGIGIFVDDAVGADAHANGALTYSPRVNFLETETMSLSIGIPLSVGLSANYNSGYGGESGSLGFMVNTPLIVNINLGCGSTKENESRFGFFTGGGFGYYHGSYYYTDTYYGEDMSSSINAYGPAANLGLRFGVGGGTKNIEARLSYMKGIDVSKANIFGIGALFNF